MKLIEKVKKYIEEKTLLSKEDKLLVAVSGGVDSMVLLNILNELGFSIIAAHCNFKLRNEAADKDEKLVKAFAEELGLGVVVKAFDTSNFASQQRISIQMAARELRYEWFSELLKEYNCSCIVTAHHQNDVAETMLINLTKGTGLSGLHGIQSSKRVIRPLLLSTRKDIESYAQQQDIPFREDASNQDEKYMRNTIRHQVVPKLEELNPKFIENINDTAQYLSDIEKIVEQKIEAERLACMKSVNNSDHFNISYLKKLSPLPTYLYYLLLPYGFTAAQVANIVASLDEQPGKVFHSNAYELVKDRDELIISMRINKMSYNIEICNMSDFENSGLCAEISFDTNYLSFTHHVGWAFLDLAKVQFPLLLRNWKEGDRFQPLGMTGQKKVSDFLVDIKINRSAKKDVCVLESDGEICWLVNHRINDKYKVTDSTKNVLILKSK